MTSLLLSSCMLLSSDLLHSCLSTFSYSYLSLRSKPIYKQGPRASKENVFVKMSDGSDVVSINAADLEGDVGLNSSNRIPEIVLSDAPDADRESEKDEENEIYTIGSALRSFPRQLSQISQETARKAREVRNFTIKPFQIFSAQFRGLGICSVNYYL